MTTTSWAVFMVVGVTLNSLDVVALQLDFRVTPAVVKPRETTNVSIQCVVTETAPYYNNQQGYYYNQYGQYVLATNPPPTGSNAIDVAMIRILKNTQDKWQAIAQISNVAPKTVHKLDSTITNVSGIISDDSTLRSFINVNWDLATADVYGRYRCDAINFDINQNAILTTSSEIALGSTLDALDLLLLLQHETSVMREMIREQDGKQAKCKNTTETLKFDYQELKKYTVNKHNDADEKVKNQSDYLKSQNEIMEKRISDMKKEFTDEINKVRTLITVVMDSGFLMLWPRGSYGLLKPTSGCPSGGVTWKTGWRRHHTESTDRNQDSVSADTHLQKPALERQNGNNFVSQHFCMKTDAITVGPVWPKGSYCINKKGECPNVFQTGYITWDEENDQKNQTSQGELPSGIYNSSDVTTIEYCCRNDAPANVSVYLPTSDPFYLYRYGGFCQKVYGMFVTEEYLLFDTENTNNSDKISPVHPDGRINNLRLELCYYQRS